MILSSQINCSLLKHVPYFHPRSTTCNSNTHDLNPQVPRQESNPSRVLLAKQLREGRCECTVSSKLHHVGLKSIAHERLIRRDTYRQIGQTEYIPICIPFTLTHPTPIKLVPGGTCTILCVTKDRDLQLIVVHSTRQLEGDGIEMVRVNCPSTVQVHKMKDIRMLLYFAVHR